MAEVRAMAQKAPANVKMWVRNLPDDVDQETLEVFFGDAEAAVLMKKGEACVVFDSESALQMGLDVYSDYEVLGNTITVDAWSNRPAAAPKARPKEQAAPVKGPSKGGPSKGGKGPVNPYHAIEARSSGKGKAGKYEGYVDYGGDKGYAVFGKGKKGKGMKPGWTGVDRATPQARGVVTAERLAWAEQNKPPPLPDPLSFKEAPESSSVVAQGLASEGCIVCHNKSDTVFSSAAHILAELVGDVAEHVTFEHDENWSIYPELGELVPDHKNWPGCLAVCPEAGRWALGLAGGWQNRERAAKLSMSVLLARDSPEAMKVLQVHYPEFAAFCNGSSPGAAAGAKGGSSYDGEPLSKAAKKRANQQWSAQPYVGSLPQIFGITVSPTCELAVNGMTEGPAVVYTKETKEAFQSSHHILTELVGDIGEVDFQDHQDWGALPEVGSCMVRLGGPDMNDMPFTIAVSPGKDVWAVGIATSWKGRQPAAKMALALGLAMKHGSAPKLCELYPDFQAVWAVAVGEPSTKRR